MIKDFIEILGICNKMSFQGDFFPSGWEWYEREMVTGKEFKVRYNLRAIFFNIFHLFDLI